MSKCEPARFHSAGSKSFCIAAGSSLPPCAQASLASDVQSSMERFMRSLRTSVPGGGSPCIANGDGFPSDHAWKRLFWFSFQNLSHSFVCCSIVSFMSFSLSLGRGPGRGSVERHDLPNRLAFVEKVETLVDVFQLELPGHEPVHRELAHLVELDVARQVAGRDPAP